MRMEAKIVIMDTYGWNEEKLWACSQSINSDGYGQYEYFDTGESIEEVDSSIMDKDSDDNNGSFEEGNEFYEKTLEMLALIKSITLEEAHNSEVNRWNLIDEESKGGQTQDSNIAKEKEENVVEEIEIFELDL